MRSKSLKFELLESRQLLHGDGVEVTPTAVITEHDTVPRFAAQANFIAVQSGDWSNPLTWNTRQVPGNAAKVRIPTGIDVDYDVRSAVRIEAIEIFGQLDFETDISTSLWVSEIMVMPHGLLTVGTVLNPVRNGVTSEIVFTDSEPKTGTESAPGVDVSNYGNGFLVFGNLQIQGAVKTAYARAMADIESGSETLTVDAAPFNWRPTDVLVLPETSQTIIRKDEVILNESETVELARINGADISLSSPLEFDHYGITQNSFGIERYAHVANLTRNVVLRSENPAGYRGHFMAMADAKVTIANAAFESLGRTKADMPATSPLYNSNGSLFAIGNNQVGRYPIHMHHLENPFLIDGVVVNDALKWGIAIHDTNNGILQNSIVYDTDGSAIVTEDGSETGNSFLNNLVIKVDGGYQRNDPRAGVSQIIDGQGKLTNDIGADGSGFWLRSSAGSFAGNVVYDAAGYAFNFNGYYRMPPPNAADRADFLKQIDLFSGNEAVSSKGGLWLTWSQGLFSIENYKRQVFNDFLAWNVQAEGVKAYHEANVTLRNITLVNSSAASNQNEGSATTFRARSNTGLWFGSESYQNFNLKLENVKVEGFNVGILAPVHAGPEGASIDGAFLRNYVNIAFEQSAEPSTLRIANVTYAPSYTVRIARSFPENVANIWHEGRGTISQGQLSDDAPPGLASTLGVKIDLRRDGRLRLISGSASDDVALSVEAGRYVLRINNNSYRYDRSLITSIVFWGNGGDDAFVNSTSLPLLAFGGDGNDLLVGGSSQDRLLGESGNDTLRGLAADDLLFGGAGNDILEGGDGRDTARGETGDDVIYGGAGADLLLEGGAGNDSIFGGDGDDLVIGGTGDDFLNGESGNDYLGGEAGNDFLFGGLGDDTVSGGIGNDTLRGGAGRDKLWGGDGDDELWYDAIDWFAFGGLGNDRYRFES